MKMMCAFSQKVWCGFSIKKRDVRLIALIGYARNTEYGMLRQFAILLRSLYAIDNHSQLDKG